MQTTKADALYAGADLHGNNVFLSLCDMVSVDFAALADPFKRTLLGV